MTVAIGLVCSDGVVVASDSMASTISNTAHPAQKVRACPELNAVWTAAGSVYIIEEVDQALKDLEVTAASQPITKAAFAKPDLPVIRQNLQSFVCDAMKRAYGSAMPGVNAIPTPFGGTQHPWHSDFLVLGYSSGTPYALEIAGDGQLNWHTAAKFCAVGSGGPFADVTNGLMAHYVEGDDLPVKLGLWVAYRAIETTCRVSSSLVGPPVQLAVVDEGGARVLSSEEIDEVDAGVQGWLTAEKASLREPNKAIDNDDVEEPPTLEASS